MCVEILFTFYHYSRYNLNSLRTEEKEIWLSAVYVDDGQWHVAKVTRYGSAAILTLDGGEGRRYNDSFKFLGHQMMAVDKQEGVYAGGKAEYTGVRTFEVYSDFSKGIDNIFCVLHIYGFEYLIGYTLDFLENDSLEYVKWRI